MSREGGRRNVVASVRDRLRDLARERGDDFNYLLTRFGLERLLYRLSRSRHRDDLILKGAMLFQVWGDEPHRPTRDLDLLGRGEATNRRFEQVFREICRVEVEDDGLVFDEDSVRGEEIRGPEKYGGIRVRLQASLGRARIPIQVDLGIGDAVTAGPVEIEYPTLLEMPPPILRAYSRETVVAEKFQAMVMLGIANSRMKDFYDVFVLCRDFDFAGPVLAEAIRATFERRGTALPEVVPTALSDTFVGDPSKQRQWTAFLGKGKLDAPSLEEVAAQLRGFVLPPVAALRSGSAFEAAWRRGGPWAGQEVAAGPTRFVEDPRAD